MQKLLISYFFFLISIFSIAQEKQYFVSCIGFWNVENFYDTLDDPLTDDKEFLPDGENRWNSEKYERKLKNLSEVISQMGTEISPDGLAILGLAEIENKNVLEDLVKTEKLKKFNYEIVHYNSPDKRGVDVALIYQPKYFKVTSSKTFTLKMPNDTGFYTRDQLLVSGIFDEKPLHIIVAHWPSRRGGEAKSSPKRIAAAILARSIIDSLTAADSEARIMFMGDLNDDPVNVSVKKNLRTNADKSKLRNGELFNPMEDLYDKGIGTLAWNDSWNLFDQIILSQPLVKNEFSSFEFFGAKVFNKPFVRQDEGNFKGYPFRTFAGGNYTGGYSDHFAVYVILAKERK